jgi:hypothetical protein
MDVTASKPSDNAASEPTAEPELTGAQRKAQVKAAKAARRAAAKPVTAPAGAPKVDQKSVHTKAPSPGTPKTATEASSQAAPESQKPRIHPWFSHLRSAPRDYLPYTLENVELPILKVGGRLTFFKLSESIDRAEDSLLAMKQVGYICDAASSLLQVSNQSLAAHQGL